MVANAADGDPSQRVHLALRAAAGSVAALDAVLLSTFENGMRDDVCRDRGYGSDRELLDLDDPTGAVRHAVIGYRRSR